MTPVPYRRAPAVVAGLVSVCLGLLDAQLLLTLLAETIWPLPLPSSWPAGPPSSWASCSPTLGRWS